MFRFARHLSSQPQGAGSLPCYLVAGIPPSRGCICGELCLSQPLPAQECPADMADPRGRQGQHTGAWAEEGSLGAACLGAKDRSMNCVSEGLWTTCVRKTTVRGCTAGARRPSRFSHTFPSAHKRLHLLVATWGLPCTITEPRSCAGPGSRVRLTLSCVALTGASRPECPHKKTQRKRQGTGTAAVAAPPQDAGERMLSSQAVATALLAWLGGRLLTCLWLLSLCRRILN